jgi:hypothetical protein
MWNTFNLKRYFKWNGPQPHHFFEWFMRVTFKVGTDWVSWRGTTQNKTVLIIVEPKIPWALGLLGTLANLGSWAVGLSGLNQIKFLEKVCYWENNTVFWRPLAWRAKLKQLFSNSKTMITIVWFASTAIFFISQYNLRVSNIKNHYFISSYFKL